MEFQIPNVYYANPDKKAEVNWRGLENVTVFSENIQADGWEWNFTLPGTGMTEYFRAYTQDCEDCVNGVRLVLCAWSGATTSGTLRAAGAAK